MTEPQRAPIGGRYQVLTTLGRGGMGVVYKAHDPVLERDVAIKQMSTSLVDNDEHRRRFHIEARAAARLNHPNIVTIYELEEHHGDVFIIMELLEGLSLGTLLQRGVTLPLEAQLSILAQVADGLDFAHARAIVHRDIKPANLVLLPTGVVKILDFGIAQLAASGLTKQGALLGTPNYMAPEQVRGEPVDARADLFSAGAVAYELVSGMKAFSADSVPALLLKIAEAQHAPLAAVAPQVAPALAALVDRLLAKERDDRPARGADVRAALEAIGPIDRLDLIADAVALALSPSEGDTLVQFPMPDRHTTPVASRSSVSSRMVTPPPSPSAGATPPPAASQTPPPALPPLPPPSSSSVASVQQITQNLGPKEPLAPVVPPLPVPASEPAARASSAPPASAAESPAAPPVLTSSTTPSAATPSPPPLPIPLPPGLLPDAPSDVPAAAAGTLSTGTPSTATPSTGAPPPLPLPLVGDSAAPAPPPASAPPAASGSASSTPSASTAAASTANASTATGSTPPSLTSPAPPPASTSSTPVIGAAVPAARRAGNGTAIIVLGLAAALAGVFIGASYMWWQRLRAEIKPRVTTESTATPSSSSPSSSPSSDTPGSETPSSGTPSSETPSSSSETAATPSSTEAVTTGETPTQTGEANAKPGDAPVEAATPPGGATPSGEATPSTSPSNASTDTTSAPTSATSTPTSASNNANAANAANASNAPRASNSAKPPSSTASTTREPASSAPPANTASNARNGARTAVTEPRSFREPAPPVDTTQPPPPDEPGGPPAPPTDAPARGARSAPPPRTTVDAETVGAFRRSGGDATAVLGGDQTMMAAAAVRIKDTIERYGAALQARDADAVRGYRDSLSLAEQRLLDGAGAAVRFSDIDVDVEAPTQATARARRTITPAGQAATSETVTLRLVRKPSGWVITAITR